MGSSSGAASGAMGGAAKANAPFSTSGMQSGGAGSMTGVNGQPLGNGPMLGQGGNPYWSQQAVQQRGGNTGFNGGIVDQSNGGYGTHAMWPGGGSMMPSPNIWKLPQGMGGMQQGTSQVLDPTTGNQMNQQDYQNTQNRYNELQQQMPVSQDPMKPNPFNPGQAEMDVLNKRMAAWQAAPGNAPVMHLMGSAAPSQGIMGAMGNRGMGQPTNGFGGGMAPRPFLPAYNMGRAMGPNMIGNVGSGMNQPNSLLPSSGQNLIQQYLNSIGNPNYQPPKPGDMVSNGWGGQMKYDPNWQGVT